MTNIEPAAHSEMTRLHKLKYKIQLFRIVALISGLYFFAIGFLIIASVNPVLDLKIKPVYLGIGSIVIGIGIFVIDHLILKRKFIQYQNEIQEKLNASSDSRNESNDFLNEIHKYFNK